MKHKKEKTGDDHSENMLKAVSTKESIGEPTEEIIDMTRRLLDLETRYEEAEKLSSEIYEQKTKLEIALYERMKDIGIDQFRTAEFGLISCANRLWGKITNLEAAEGWLKENGLYNEVLKLKPIAARVNEVIKKQLEEGKPIPPGFDYSLTRTISHRAK